MLWKESLLSCCWRVKTLKNLFSKPTRLKGYFSLLNRHCNQICLQKVHPNPNQNQRQLRQENQRQARKQKRSNQNQYEKINFYCSSMPSHFAQLLSFVIITLISISFKTMYHAKNLINTDGSLDITLWIYKICEKTCFSHYHTICWLLTF